MIKTERSESEKSRTLRANFSCCLDNQTLYFTSLHLAALEPFNQFNKRKLLKNHILFHRWNEKKKLRNFPVT